MNRVRSQSLAIMLLLAGSASAQVSWPATESEASRVFEEYAPDSPRAFELLPARSPSHRFQLSALAADDGGTFGLPLLGEEARKAGYELPKAFGVAGIYNYLERDVDVRDLRIGIDGAPLTSVSDFVDLGSRSHVNVGLGRLDMFLFPFLNLYTLLGYVHNESSTKGNVTVDPPGPGGPISFPFSAETELDGFVGGFGMTVAGGYKQLFVALDANWTQTDIGFDDEFRAVVASLRTGWNGKIQGTPVRLWTGGAYWDTATTARATVQVPGTGSVAFEADQGPANPWNMVFGGQATFHENIDLFLETGTNFDDMKYFAFGLTFRF